MPVRAYSKDSISSIMEKVWRACPSHRPREIDGADFGCIWIQSNGVMAHVEIKGCCKSEAFELLQYRAYFGDWKGFYN
jgi:hypothetical protein